MRIRLIGEIPFTKVPIGNKRYIVACHFPENRRFKEEWVVSRVWAKSPLEACQGDMKYENVDWVEVRDKYHNDQ